MALFTLMALTAVVAGGTAQDPSMDLQIAAPVLTSDQFVTTSGSLLVSPVQQGEKITTQFRNAKASEILEWMEKRGVSFVVNDGDIKSDTRVTLAVTDTPLESVLDALASALGGHWERRDKIRVFHKGQGFATVYGTSLRAVPTPPNPPMSMSVPPQAFFKMDGKAFDKDFEKRMKDMAAEMEKKFGPEFQKKLQDSMKDAQAFTFEDGQSFRVLQGKERDEAMKEAEKARKEAMKDAEKARKEALKMAEEARKMAGEARKEALKEAEKARGEAQRARTESLRSRDLSTRLETKVYRLAPLNQGGRRTFITPSFPVDGMDMVKFLKSLSANQRDTQEKRGFIRYNDLTREQKHLLGVQPSGKFEIRIKVNQDEVVVRGE